MIKRKGEPDLAVKLSTKEKHEGEGLAMFRREGERKEGLLYVGGTHT